MAKTEELTASQKKRKKALADSYEYARGIENNPEMRKRLKRKRVQGQSMTREDFRRKYLS